ncbi:MAG: hypothetical protein ACXU8Z_18325 [Caulobacteraceae bacterium]
MFDGIIDSPLGLVFLCAVGAAMVVSPGYMSPYMNRLAIPASMPARFPLRSFARAALIVFVLLINAVGLGLTHRVPVGSTLIAVGFLMLLFLPPDEPHNDSGL